MDDSEEENEPDDKTIISLYPSSKILVDPQLSQSSSLVLEDIHEVEAYVPRSQADRKIRRIAEFFVNFLLLSFSFSIGVSTNFIVVFCALR